MSANNETAGGVGAVPTISVTVHGTPSYDVHIGQALMASAVESLPTDANKVLIVHSAVMAAHADTLQQLIGAAGKAAVLAEVPDAEAGKTAEVMAFCWQVLGKSDFHRTDVVVGLGGGAVTDLAGFVASTWLRGIRAVQVPTTLLAMVDAAVGGKTGINTSEGKNLVGAFHLPQSVWCDVNFLLTLPRNDFVAGLAEVVKAGFIRDGRILEIAEAHVEQLSARESNEPIGVADLAVVAELMALAIQVKADVVGEDLKESHLREILNYGHTFAHAIEYTERYQWRHGAAVSVGMMFAAELARMAGKLSDDEVERHRALLDNLGLPTQYDGGLWDALFTAMKRDKKTRGDLLRFVILDGIGNPVRLEGPDPAMLAAAYASVSKS